MTEKEMLEKIIALQDEIIKLKTQITSSHTYITTHCDHDFSSGGLLPICRKCGEISKLIIDC